MDASTVGLHDALEDGEAEAAAGRTRRVERLEELRGVPRRQAFAFVVDGDAHLAVAGLQVHADGASRRRGLDGVPEDVEERLQDFDQRVAGKIGDALALEETFSPAALAGPLVAMQATDTGVLGVYRLGDGSLRVDMQISAPVAWSSRSVAECEALVDGRVVEMTRQGRKLPRPQHDTVIQKGDLVTLDVPAENVARVRPQR